jgi:hypothetical protein
MINSLFLRHNDQDSVVNLKNMLVDIAEAQVQLLTYKSGIQITNREIGEVVFSILPVLSPNFMELDGRTISESAYPNFFKHLRLLKAKYPEYFCSAEEYAAYMSEHHICPLFFLDEENNACRIPKVSGLIEAQGLSAHGFYPYNTISEETVPNLKGDFGSVTGSNSTRFSYANTHTGVFSNTEQRNTKRYFSITSGEATDNSWGATFDASAYDKRYKDDSKVHPKTTVLKCYMIVGRDSSYPHIVYSWHDDQNSVRVYSDGYCQQEGIIGPEGNQKTVTFNYPLVSNVNVQVTPYRLGADQSGSSFLITEMTNTSFSMNKEQDVSFKFSVTGYVDLSIIPTEVDYRAQSTDVLEMMEYEKEIKTKLSKTVLVNEMPPEEERDPEAMYIVVNPENIKVVQDVTNVFYGSSEKENYSGELQTSFYHSGNYEVHEVTEHEVFSPEVGSNNPEQTFTFTEFKDLPEVSELPEDTYVKEITKTSVTIGYKGFTPDTHNDTTSNAFSSEALANGERVSGTLNGTLYHSGAFKTNVEEVDEQFKFVSPDEDYTLEFTNEYDSVPTITPSEDSEIEIISISTTQAVIRGQGSGTVAGTKTTRVFETETKSVEAHADITLSKEYIEPQLIVPDDSEVEITLDGQVVHVKGTLSADVDYPDGVQTSKEFTFEVHETHIELPTIEDEENTFQGDVYPEGKPEDTQNAEVTEHTSDETSESFVGTMRATAYHSGEYTEESTEKSLTSSAKDLDTVLGYKVMKFGFAYDNVPKVQNSTNGEVLRLTEKHAILSQDTSEGDITVSGTATFKKFEPETVSKTVEKVLEFNNAYEKEPQYDVAGTGVTVEPLQTEAPYTSVKVSKEVTGTVEYGAPLEISEEFKVNVNNQ